MTGGFPAVDVVLLTGCAVAVLLQGLVLYALRLTRQSLARTHGPDLEGRRARLEELLRMSDLTMSLVAAPFLLAGIAVIYGSAWPAPVWLTVVAVSILLALPALVLMWGWRSELARVRAKLDARE